MKQGEAAHKNQIWYLILGWFFVALGILGVILPVVPATPFMILAAWAFSRSSERFESWLLHHKVFGPSIRRWRAHRVIPLKVKIVSIGAMFVTLALSIASQRIPWWGLLAQALVMGYGAWFTLRCPSRAPNEPQL